MGFSRAGGSISAQQWSTAANPAAVARSPACTNLTATTDATAVPPKAHAASGAHAAADAYAAPDADATATTTVPISTYAVVLSICQWDRTGFTSQHSTTNVLQTSFR